MNSHWKNILLVAGARPNFMKVAPLYRELQKYPKIFNTQLIHTGQHYDSEMSEVFFSELDLPRPDYYLGVGSGSHAEQTAKVMVSFEEVCKKRRPDLVVVVGDVNSTMACAITAKKLCIPVAHVEAGLRSRDDTMPEEINRVVTDRLSDLLFTPSRDADKNLLQEGIPQERIHFVGNVMIDSLQRSLLKAKQRDIQSRFGVEAKNYAVLTLHRPSNVDDPLVLSGIVKVLMEVSQELPIIWPIHPRTKRRLEDLHLLNCISDSLGLRLSSPLGYLDMLALNQKAQVILTDSGGLQEEATVLGVPCVTLRNNTERPITVDVGANRLVGNHPGKIWSAITSIRKEKVRPCSIPELWDGKTASRIVEILSQTTRLIHRNEKFIGCEAL